MASAVSTPQEVKLVVVNEGSVVLTLSHEEAITLHDIVRSIGGDDRKSRRVHTNSISKALREAAVPYASFPVPDMQQGNRTIYFNYKE